MFLSQPPAWLAWLPWLHWVLRVQRRLWSPDLVPCQRHVAALSRHLGHRLHGFHAIFTAEIDTITFDLRHRLDLIGIEHIEEDFAGDDDTQPTIFQGFQHLIDRNERDIGSEQWRQVVQGCSDAVAPSFHY